VSGEPGTPLSLGIRTIGPEPAGATLLDDADLRGLIPGFVATREDLNQVEFENIVKALSWANRQTRLRGTAGLLAYPFLFKLHRRMFGDVWRWAGKPRQRETNIGADPVQIPSHVIQALDDARFWHDNRVFTADDIAVRLHHRLVSIRPFPNGNGRTTRLIADLYLTSVGETPFTWGTSRPDSEDETRKAYIESLVAAPTDDCQSLVVFARS
jgi:Fic-DOC domain mobile mystery protein B